MTWSLDAPIKYGTAVFGVIVVSRVTVRRLFRAFFGQAQKLPVHVLILDRGQVIAFDLSGRNCDLEDIERRYPNAIVDFLHLAEEARD